MIFDIESGGRSWTVDLGRAGQEWLVAIDGRRLRASFVPAGDRCSLLVRPAEADGAGPSRSHDVAFETADRGQVLVHVDGAVVPATVQTPASRLRRSSSGPAGGGPTQVLAPMAGRVVKVLVAPGVTVKARQGLVIVEAMKMENELRAPRAGIVRDVRVVEGASVDAHMVLVVLDEPPDTPESKP